MPLPYELDYTQDLIKIVKAEKLGPLPELMTFEDGGKVVTPEDWEKRREEIYRTAVELQYGEIPPEPEFLEVERFCDGGDGGTYRIKTGRRSAPVYIDFTVYMPKGVENPAVAVDGDACWRYFCSPGFVDVFNKNGVALVMFNRTELAHDVSAERPFAKGQLYDAYPDYSFGDIGAWSWGFSRVVDALEKIGGVDLGTLAFTGHSRGGKTAMLAGVRDKRAAIVNPNETNCGACGCYRVHTTAITEDGGERRSETLADMTANFPSWLGPKMKDYAEREQDLPFDCHFLKALVSPRTLLIGEAASDIWTNPVGCVLTDKAAQEAFDRFGGDFLWYFRRGWHSHTIFDARQLVAVMRHKKYGDGLDLSGYFRTPFGFDEDM